MNARLSAGRTKRSLASQCFVARTVLWNSLQFCVQGLLVFGAHFMELGLGIKPIEAFFGFSA